jgi:hypothetical protein
MSEMIEVLSGVEVKADDFLVIEFGDSGEEALAKHDTNLTAFLDRARQRNLRLAPEKAELRLTEVTFMGHK